MQYFSVTKIENKIQSTTDSYDKYHLSFYYLVHCLLYLAIPLQPFPHRETATYI
jgi:hypothetical protein